LASIHPTSVQPNKHITAEAWVPAFLLDPFLKLWQDSKSPLRPTILFSLGLGLICGVTVFIGAVPTKVFGHDVFIPVELGWRVLNGQRPHLDFVSGFGPVWPLLEALGLTVSRHSVNGVGYASALVALIVGIWCFLLTRNLLLDASRILLSLFLAVLIASPHPLSVSPFMTSHAMAYNRYGYALVGLILAECCGRIRGAPNTYRRLWINGFSTGAALGLTLFLKSNFFLVAAVLVALISCLLGQVTWRRIFAVLAGFCFVSVAMLGYLRFDLAAMLRDLHMVAGARAGALSSLTLAGNVVDNASVLLTVVLFLFTAWVLFGDRITAWRAYRLPAIGLLIFCADIGLMSSNTMSGGFSLCAVFAILIFDEVVRDLQSSPGGQATSYRPAYVGALCLSILLFVPLLTSDLTGLAYGALIKARPPASGKAQNFISPNLKPLLLYDGAEPRSNGTALATYVNDGVAILQLNSRPDETILSMDMANPFPYALQRKPAHGGFAAPTYGLNIDDQHRPSAEEMLGNADIVMVPKHPATDQFFANAYRTSILRGYYLAAQDGWWWMYRRRSASPQLER
jgi:hypothetical protein